MPQPKRPVAGGAGNDELDELRAKALELGADATDLDGNPQAIRDLIARLEADAWVDVDERLAYFDLDRSQLAELDLDAARAIVDGLEAAVDRARDAVEEAPVPLITAIAAAMLEAGEVTKSSVNTEQGYKFASAEAILAAVRRPLLSRGILLTAQPAAYIEREISSSRGTKGTLYSLGVDFTFRDGTGAELVITDWRGIGQDFGDKAIGKAYTNAIKTFVRTQWLLPTEHDDPESSSPGERVDAGKAAESPRWTLEATDERKVLLLDALEPLIGRDQGKALALAVKQSIGHVPDVLIPFARGITASFLAGAEEDAVERRRAALERADSAAADAARRAQDAAAERPDPPAPEPTSDVTPDELLENVRSAIPGAEGPPPVEDTIRQASDEELAEWAQHHANERVRGLAAAELDTRRAESIIAGETDEPTGPPPGTVDVGELPSNPAAAIGTLKAAGCICPDPLGHRGEQPDTRDACPIKGHGIPF